MRFNDAIKGPDPSYVGAMAVTVTGGTAEDRLAVKSVIFNALEGAKFSCMDYVDEDIPNMFADLGKARIMEPVEDVASLLELCVEANPLLFYTSITLESAPSLLQGFVQPEDIRRGWAPDPDVIPNNEAWERVTSDLNKRHGNEPANDSVKEVVIEGTVRFKF